MVDQDLSFLDLKREGLQTQAPELRKKHSKEFVRPYEESSLKRQTARCMDCGVAFCHNACPLHNKIPEFNKLAREGRLQEAAAVLHETNNFPEFTGRLCPAPCESACVLGINQDPVAIENIEYTIAEAAFANGWVKAKPAEKKLALKLAVVGSGPAGLAAAQQCARAGMDVDVYEKSDRPGGLLVYGIPDFKLAKTVVDRRLRQLKEEGVRFICNQELGRNLYLDRLQQSYDAVLLACGAPKPRDLKVPGRDCEGVYFAHDILQSATKELSGRKGTLNAAGRRVIVIGGGDTGSDCVGTSLRQGALSVKQFEILPKPADLGRFPKRNERPKNAAWPAMYHSLKTTSSHEEGCERYWSLATTRFLKDDDNRLQGIETVQVDQKLEPVAGTKKIWNCDLVLLAMGYEDFSETKLFENKGADYPKISWERKHDQRYATAMDGVYYAGDMRRGQSLIVWAIAEGRAAAHEILEKFT